MGGGGIMMLAEFVKWVQGYYGKYPEGQKDDLKSYFRDLSPGYFDALRWVLTRRYSSKWGRPPDIAVFEEVKGEVMERLRYSDQPKPLLEEQEELISPEQARSLRERFAQLLQGRSYAK
jgi:hypothetical protein